MQGLAVSLLSVAAVWQQTRNANILPAYIHVVEATFSATDSKKGRAMEDKGIREIRVRVPRFITPSILLGVLKKIVGWAGSCAPSKCCAAKVSAQRSYWITRHDSIHTIYLLVVRGDGGSFSTDHEVETDTDRASESECQLIRIVLPA